VPTTFAGYIGQTLGPEHYFAKGMES